MSSNSWLSLEDNNGYFPQGEVGFRSSEQCWSPPFWCLFPQQLLILNFSQLFSTFAWFIWAIIAAICSSKLPDQFSNKIIFSPLPSTGCWTLNVISDLEELIFYTFFLYCLFILSSDLSSNLSYCTIAPYSCFVQLLVAHLSPSLNWRTEVLRQSEAPS